MLFARFDWFLNLDISSDIHLLAASGDAVDYFWKNCRVVMWASDGRKCSWCWGMDGRNEWKRRGKKGKWMEGRNGGWRRTGRNDGEEKWRSKKGRLSGENKIKIRMNYPAMQRKLRREFGRFRRFRGGGGFGPCRHSTFHFRLAILTFASGFPRCSGRWAWQAWTRALNKHSSKGPTTKAAPAVLGPACVHGHVQAP